MDARVKIAALFIYSVTIFFVHSRLVFGILIVLVVIAVGASVIQGSTTLHQYVASLIPVIILALFAFGFGFWNDPTLEGASSATLVALRMVLLVLASFTVCFTTTSTQLMRAFKWFLDPLRHVNVPVKDVCFVLALAIRFIPQIAAEYFEVKRAQDCRGADLPHLSIKRRLSNAGATFSAVFIGLFRRADSIATAMDARCYGLKRNEELLLQRSENASQDLT